MAITSALINKNGGVQLFEGLNKIREWGQNYIAATADGTHAYTVTKYGEVWRYDSSGNGKLLSGKSLDAVSIQGSNDNITILLKNGSSDVYVNGHKTLNTNRPNDVTSKPPQLSQNPNKPAQTNCRTSSKARDEQYRDRDEQKSVEQNKREERRKEQQLEQDRRTEEWRKEEVELAEVRRQQEIQTQSTVNTLSTKLLELALLSVDDYSTAEKKTAMFMRSKMFTSHVWHLWDEIKGNNFLLNTFIYTTFSVHTTYEEKYNILIKQSGEMRKTMLSWIKQQKQTEFIKDLKKCCVAYQKRLSAELKQIEVDSEKYIKQLEAREKEEKALQSERKKFIEKYEKYSQLFASFAYWTTVSFFGIIPLVILGLYGFIGLLCWLVVCCLWKIAFNRQPDGNRCVYETYFLNPERHCSRPAFSFKTLCECFGDSVPHIFSTLFSLWLAMAVVKIITNIYNGS